MLALTGTACHSDAPTTAQTTSSAPVPAAKPTAPAAAATGKPADTLHLPGGQVLTLRSTTAAAFNQLPASTLPDMPNDPAAEHLPAGGPVRRQGLDLVLQPAQGSAVRLASTPDAEFTLQNAQAVKYQYWGRLPAAHQWVVRAWYWEAAGTVLIDQRTGRRLELPGDPVASPDGRLVLLTSPGLDGSDQGNLLGLAQIDASGPRLLWQREPTAWEPNEARWASPTQAILKLRHVVGEGSIPNDAPETYAELALPH